MFKQYTTPVSMVEIVLDGKAETVPYGVSVAAALLAIGKITARTSPAAHEDRAPHCLMGICFECLMEIDGIQRQACMTEVREGMVVNRRLEANEGGA